jgi:hypothetical protein
MNLNEFKAATQQTAPPPALNPALLALWHDARGDWEAAHQVCQASNSALDWVHAYLHRKEGDAANAAYWYRRAGKPVSNQSLAEEWESIARSLLTQVV